MPANFVMDDRATIKEMTDSEDMAIPHGPLYRWDDLDSDIRHHQTIVQDLRNRDRASRLKVPTISGPNSSDDLDLPVKNGHLYPTPQDPELYRVRVHVHIFKPFLPSRK